ncbi:DNA repair protein RecN [Saccharobesus litoralis]|uniref:DNA repair protein RecN n=1 Tax=Saccharobesus litoralis TaxID=2172099 RepID=A0A2S0VVF2_9ALTE|nr:DNA repair protein RecN [Saccharobesus litoralis]AWB68196.1 DNA repair protein RecN [Saccharobesus litoralis]
MLTQLFVKDFAIVENLDIEFQPGMTTITGETGAGKSISIDALGLCLGDRAEAGMVRNGANKTEIAATFNIQNISAAQQWLVENELLDEGEYECIIRRTVSAEGRSRAYVNGAPVAAQQLKSLARHLVNIHGQHAHQLLVKPEYQLSLLDDFSGHTQLLENSLNSYQYWAMQRNELAKLKEQEQQRADRLQLIEYQVAELDEFALVEGEFEQIEAEHKRLSNAVNLLNESQMAMTMLYDSDEHSACGLVQSIANKLSNLASTDAAINGVVSMLSEASINLQEASNELRHYVDGIEPDPERLMQLEDRMSTAMELSRKHRIAPELLYQEHEKLSAELLELKSFGELGETLALEVEKAEQRYWQAADELHASRCAAAQKLSSLITASMQELNMAQAEFKIQVDKTTTPSKLGSDNIEFLVCANLGQSLQPISKVASGGELSRISLAIQVITAEKVDTPTLIFDEVDVGISGATAAVVGQMLRRIGDNTQVVCVTHLPQVAACGHNQMQVSKHNEADRTHTKMFTLDNDSRVVELARLLGGDKLTDTAIANARDLLAG